MKRNHLLACASALLLTLGGCASYSGSQLKPGVSDRAETRASMGEPAAIHKAQAGAPYAESWEYPHGPVGRHTYMVRFGADGKVVRVDQVLMPKTLQEVRIGATSRDDVASLLGRPGSRAMTSLGEQWTYYAIDPEFPRKITMTVTFDQSGRVKSAGQSDDMSEFMVNAGGS